MKTKQAKQYFTLEEMKEELHKAIAEAGSQVALATRLGVSQAYITKTAKNLQNPGDKILNGLGYKKVVLYEKLS